MMGKLAIILLVLLGFGPALLALRQQERKREEV
jgi:hypothetical protein